MANKKRYYLIGFFLLCAAIIGYHFLAAAQAEQQIDKAIQEQSAENEALSVQYSSIEVAPFAATITIRDLTLIFGKHIERAQNLKLDIHYLDFLNIYLGGVSYGLNRLDRADVTATRASYINRSGLEEIKLDTLNLVYTGNVLDGLKSAVNKTEFNRSHSIEAKSTGLKILFPQTTLSKIVAEEFRYFGSVPKGEQNFWINGQHEFAMDSLTWTPSKSFQNNYRFFIEGFGYSTDAIPFQSAQLHSQAKSQSDILEIESSVKSELALVSGSGLIELKKPFGDSELQNMRIRMNNFSDSFNTVLNNLERLLSISLPQSSDGITLKVEGTLSRPSVSKQ